MCKYSELAREFRDRANENMHVWTERPTENNENLWGCICSAMDWIDVGVGYIEQFQPPTQYGAQNCMSIFSLIVAIDVVYESIKSLHWVLMQNGETNGGKRKKIDKADFPLCNEKGTFSAVKVLTITDDKFFKEIRACCGAHPTKLNTLISDDPSKKTQRRYAGWTYTENLNSFSVLLYPEQATGEACKIEIFYSELKAYFEARLNYLKILIARIDELSKL